MTVFNAPEAANRYDAARNLPDQTLAVWMDALKIAVPDKVDRVLDLGCGTGRFTAALGKTFGCSMIGVEPSAAMLSVAEAQQVPRIEWKLGDAENIPLEDGSIDLVFMSQVFHHLSHPEKALQEIRRALASAGYLAIRNATTENSKQLGWLRCFPEALEIEAKRNRTQQEIEDLVCSQSFVLVSRQTITQLFAHSYQEYYDKIKNRGLSSLIAISDEAFDSGLQRLQGWVVQQPADTPVYEPTDLFIFHKKLDN